MQREVLEETGITKFTNPIFYTAVVSNHQIKLSASETVGLVLLVYRVNISSTALITLSEEHTAYEWVTSAIAAKRLANKYPKEFIQALQ